MRSALACCVLLAAATAVHAVGLYSLEVIDIHGQNTIMANYAGNVTLVVNVASE